MTTITLREALQTPGCERLREWVEIGPVQRAALETFAAALAQQAEPVEPNRWEGDHDIESPNNACMHKGYCMSLKQAREPLAQQAEPVLQTCNCRWDGDVQVQQCTLHEAHVDAIHEWAERAKVAERKLAQQVEPVEPVAAERERCAKYLMQQAAECRENSPTRVTLESCAAVLRLGLVEWVAQQAEPERHFCERCGKRLSQDGVHTCTPPQQIEQAMLGVWQDVPGAVNFGIKE